ncbi:uncharacterized protein LOC125819027 [Solanum verrucosum]|uniref:uncharacterized protein LOC125819027 n=1 Tax=Solanum verrucosum TaxID=315347 RepID=UPI0020D07AF7|nr:uncharacterized protein LOC125819027 [Solanum verrucosum]
MSIIGRKILISINISTLLSHLQRQKIGFTPCQLQAIIGMLRDCGLYSAAYAEYLTDGQSLPLANFDVNLHRSRYGALLWNYGNQKASSGSVSDNEDPYKPRNMFVDSDGIEKINID